MYESHPVFKTQYNKKYKIWRYLNLAQFISLLERKQLHFARSDKLGDPYEGYLGKRGVQAWRDFLKELPGYKTIGPLPTVATMPEQNRKQIYVNCWHASKIESMAMWRIYSERGNGLAICTTVEGLISAFKDAPEKIYIGSVNYIDHEKASISMSNLFNPFVYKNNSFSYEKELRAAFWERGAGSIPQEKDKTENGYYINVSLEQLIKSIRLSPQSEVWFEDVIKSICDKYGLNPALVTQSSMVPPQAYS